MSLEHIHLRALLRIFGSSASLRKRLLHSDVRSIEARAISPPSSGGDFHAPFWADAKAHVRERGVLSELTKVRIESNKKRSRLYPELERGFLTWWNEKRRWINEPFEILEETISGALILPELNCTVKVENFIAARLASGSCRIVYPYFSEGPLLDQNLARLGLWAISQSIPAFDVAEFRILDVLRSRSFSVTDAPLRGNEEIEFVARYKAALLEWSTLKSRSA